MLSLDNTEEGKIAPSGLSFFLIVPLSESRGDWNRLAEQRGGSQGLDLVLCASKATAGRRPHLDFKACCLFVCFHLHIHAYSKIQ